VADLKRGIFWIAKNSHFYYYFVVEGEKDMDYKRRMCNKLFSLLLSRNKKKNGESVKISYDELLP
jgi:hypothetical protein